MLFNPESRKKNILKASAAGMIGWIVAACLGFAYRMVFLRVLTVEYLGIDSLFANVLGLLGLAELGITDAIIYRLYEPISAEDTGRVGKLMRFFRNTYRIIALVIFLLGCAVCPFIKQLIRDASEIPQDVNIYLVFLLLVANTSSTYLFSYKFSLLSADQKQHKVTIINLVITFARYSGQLLTLLATKNYTVTLAAGIVLTLLCNWLASRWVGRQYPQVFAAEGGLSDAEKKQIYRDTFAALLHKIGGTVVTSTDSILLTKFIGLAITGIYANYQLVISSLSGLIYAILNAFTPSLGNAHATLGSAERYAFYKKSLFLNFWIVGTASCCLYILLDDFIFLWLQSNLCLDRWTTLLLCILFYMETMRRVSISYTMSCGLFTRDKLRPVIESVLNIGISIVCLKWIGTAGIFMGTILSNLATVFWREPYLLYKYAFHQRLSAYWKAYLKNLAVTVGAAGIAFLLKRMLFGDSVGIAQWAVCGLLCVAVFQVLFVPAFFRTEEFRYFFGLIRQRLRRRSGPKPS